MAPYYPSQVMIIMGHASVASTAAVSAASATLDNVIIIDNYNYITDTQATTLTVGKYEYYFEPEELVDWRGLEKCFVGFKPKFNINYAGKVCSYIKQPARQYSQKRKMYVQKLKSQL